MLQAARQRSCKQLSPRQTYLHISASSHPITYSIRAGSAYLGGSPSGWSALGSLYICRSPLSGARDRATRPSRTRARAITVYTTFNISQSSAQQQGRVCLPREVTSWMGRALFLLHTYIDAPSACGFGSAQAQPRFRCSFLHIYFCFQNPGHISHIAKSLSPPIPGRARGYIFLVREVGRGG